ncbi:MAG: hypothetical protein HGA85_08115, partial [Nanoarchaeota archaeon]|nr:hypothetical protein [Nanoarchaeota archaeon]
MIQKNKLLKSMFWIVFGLVALQLAKAQTTINPFTGGSGSFSGMLNPLMQLLNYLLVEVPSTMGSLYFKALLFFLLLVMLLTITPRIPPFKDGDETTKKYGKVAAWVIALTFVVFIPDTIIIPLINLWGVVGVLLALVVVPLVLIFGTKSLSRKPKGILYFFVGLVMWLFLGQLLVMGNSPPIPSSTTISINNGLQQILPYLQLIAFGLVIYGIYLFFTPDADSLEAKADQAARMGAANVKIGEAGRDEQLGLAGIRNDKSIGMAKLNREWREGTARKGYDEAEFQEIQNLANEIVQIRADAETFANETNGLKSMLRDVESNNKLYSKSAKKYTNAGATNGETVVTTAVSNFIGKASNLKGRITTAGKNPNFIRLPEIWHT